MKIDFVGNRFGLLWPKVEELNKCPNWITNIQVKDNRIVSVELVDPQANLKTILEELKETSSQTKDYRSSTLFGLYEALLDHLNTDILLKEQADIFIKIHTFYTHPREEVSYEAQEYVRSKLSSENFNLVIPPERRISKV